MSSTYAEVLAIPLRVRKGTQAEAQRRSQVHFLRLPYPLQEARQQITHPILSCLTDPLYPNLSLSLLAPTYRGRLAYPTRSLNFLKGRALMFVAL